jgi:hypothetical protein
MQAMVAVSDEAEATDGTLLSGMALEFARPFKTALDITHLPHRVANLWVAHSVREILRELPPIRWVGTKRTVKHSSNFGSGAAKRFNECPDHDEL